MITQLSDDKKSTDDKKLLRGTPLIFAYKGHWLGGGMWVNGRGWDPPSQRLKLACHVAATQVLDSNRDHPLKTILRYLDSDGRCGRDHQELVQRSVPLRFEADSFVLRQGGRPQEPLQPLKSRGLRPYGAPKTMAEWAQRERERDHTENKLCHSKARCGFCRESWRYFLNILFIDFTT